ncbi:adenine phosphoribosyltransferase 2-like isoform X2 [Phragmites australis]|uniref:adenine phosphoribosyltransferase 2-like isoform X2 n=1 Tax=Phragmites australis TaxID=29695 RepID=UPI002D7746FD|nr:adenine phosphoribosyltransferase 2-like isoform X2 [Phragmites australis]
MGEEASCDTVSVMEVAANAKQAAKENGRAAAAVAAEAVAAPVAVADPRLHGIFDAIRVVPHFPKPGIEARGFIFGPAIALAIGAKFIPLRKPRKLPGEVISETYVLEYGTDCLEMHVGAIEPGERVLIVDDLVATGGTLCAAIRLLERAGADVVECACLIGLPKFKDFYKLNGKPVYVLVESRESETEN